MKTWLLILLFPVFGYSQFNCEYYSYISASGDHIENDTFDLEYSKIARIDFIAFTIPDSIIVIVDGIENGFFIGQFVNVGFWEVSIENGQLEILQSNSSNCPIDFFNGNHYESSIRIWVTNSRDCKFILRLHGNVSAATAFVTCISNIASNDAIKVDTITHYVCDSDHRNYNETVDCNDLYHKFVDKQIYLKSVELPSCEDKSDGQIHFTDPKYDTIVPTGLYFIETNNRFCRNSFTIPVFVKSFCKGWFIPNITRDQFGIYSGFDFQYELYLFNRWGGLVFRQFIKTNQPISLNDFQSGVYVYYFRDIQTGKIIKGDITKI